MRSLPTRVHPTTKGLGIRLERRVGTPVKGRDPSRSRREAQGLGGQHCGCGGEDRDALAGRPGRRGAAAGTPGRRPTPAPGSRHAPAGARPAPGELWGGAEDEQDPAGRRTPPPEPRCSARRLDLHLRAGRGAGPDAPWLPGGPGRRGGGAPRRCAYLLPCGGAAVTSRGRDLRRRQRRRRRQLQSQLGGRFLQEGVGSARLPRGGLPPTYSGVSAASPPSKS